MNLPLEFVEGQASSPVQGCVGAGALACPAERTGAPVKPGFGLTGWRSSAAACGHSSSGFAMMRPKTMPGIVPPLLALALLAFLSTIPARALAYAQEPSAPPSSAQTSAEPTREASQPAPEQKSAAEDQEENADLKYAAPVRWLARKTGWSVHLAYMLALGVNFAIIAVIVFWAVRKYVPGVLRNRSASIQQALDEARAASQDAHRRLAGIENRLRQLDVEIGQMQATAEKEANAEEARIQKAAEEDVRKVVLAAEQEIAAAAKQARRELTTHTAGLAIALARQQINVDSNTDQVLVRTFASKLASDASSHDHDKDGGKGGH
jgi:F-type H+-transporting ATPase subunit b